MSTVPLWLHAAAGVLRVGGGLGSGAGLLAVSAAPQRPLSVALDLHGAAAQTVGVQQQVAGLGLDLLPVVGTRGRWWTKQREN